MSCSGAKVLEDCGRDDDDDDDDGDGETMRRLTAPM